MRFRTKLVLLYAAFFFLVVSGLGIYFYQYSTRQYTQDKTNNLELMAEQVQNQFNALTEKMEYRIRFMLSDPEVLRSIVILGDPEGMRGEYLDSARNTIQNSMIIDSTMNSFYRVLYFNDDFGFRLAACQISVRFLARYFHFHGSFRPSNR